jgi:hypothetical protein
MLESGPPARLGIFSIKVNPVTPPRHLATQLDIVPSCNPIIRVTQNRNGDVGVFGTALSQLIGPV